MHESNKTEKPVNPANATLAFAAWLTTRPEVTTAGADEHCGPMAERVAEFNQGMGWKVDESQLMELNPFPVPQD